MALFVAEEPAEALLSRVGFRPEERGANTWLVVPNDEAVFVGSEEREAKWEAEQGTPDQRSTGRVSADEPARAELCH